MCKILVSVVIFLFMVGCSTQSVNQPVEWNYFGEDATTVVALVGLSKEGKHKSRAPYHRFIIENEEQSKPLVLKVDNDPGFKESAKDFITETGKYGIVKFQLKPGKYEITRIHSSSPNVSLYNKEKFSIPLVLEPNKTVFLGKFTAHSVTSKGLVGNRVLTGTYWTVDESIPFDVITKKYPELESVEIVQLESTIEFAPYFFSSEDTALNYFK